MKTEGCLKKDWKVGEGKNDVLKDDVTGLKICKACYEASASM
jgi:hypothetical protein